MSAGLGWCGSEACQRFRQWDRDIFHLEAQAKALGFEDLRAALYRARIEAGRAEERTRREHERQAEGPPLVGCEPKPPQPSPGEAFVPQEGRAVRFCTPQSLSNDVARHGIEGYFRDGRFWSADGADHWCAHEVTCWQPVSEDKAVAR